MFSVIFEVHPRQEKFDFYLDLAKDLRPILEAIDGFIDNERFESSRHPGWILSHSTWRDEKSVVRWRTVAKHHDTQQRGRDEVFQDYHLRVGEIVADTAPPAGASILEQRLDEIQRSYAGGLGEGLWNLDLRQLRLQAQGIAKLPDISKTMVKANFVSGLGSSPRRLSSASTGR